MKRLVQVADEVDEILERGGAIGAIERLIGSALFHVADAIDRAVAPPVGACAGGDAGLPRTVAIAVVARRVWRDVEVMPRCRLLPVGHLRIGPTRDLGEALAIKQPRDILRGHARQVIGGNQSHEPVALPAPRQQRAQRTHGRHDHAHNHDSLSHDAVDYISGTGLALTSDEERFYSRGIFVKNVMRAALVLLFLGGVAKPASADWLLTPYLGVVFGGAANTFNVNNLSDEFEQRVSFGASATWLYKTGRVGLEVDYHLAPNFYQITGTSQNVALLDLDSSVQTLMLNAVVGPTMGTSGPRLRPYAAVGVGLMRASVNSADKLFDNLSNNELGLNIGGGLHMFFNDRVALRGDARYFLGFKKGDDGGEDLDFEDDFNFGRATLGVTFRFGQ